MLRRSAFSLLEIMIVIAIIAAIAGIAITNFSGTQDQANIKAAQLTIKAVEDQLDIYNSLHQEYPSTEEGLEKLVEKGNFKTMPKDPWGEPIHYLYPGTHKKAYDLWSTGKDKQDGGEGVNADINNWSEE